MNPVPTRFPSFQRAGRRALLALLPGLLLASPTHAAAPAAPAASTPATQPLSAVIDATFATAAKQYAWMLANQPVSDRMPRSVEHGKLVTVLKNDWTVGFFPGALWYLFEGTGDARWRQAAEKSTHLLEDEQHNNRTHDVGFILYCSYGNGYRLTGNPAYRAILLNGATALCSRFSPAVGAIKSWDRPPTMYTFPVIIDNMMNLELLLWAARNGGGEQPRTVAVAHADTSLRNHFRPNHSSYHVVDFDTSGKVLRRITHQGIADNSAWARGQMWGLYGYTFMFRETRDPRYLAQAEAIAAFLMNHPRMPADKVPYWDFDAPGIPKEPRDSSAAALMSSALYELAGYTRDSAKAAAYRTFAEAQLRSLCSPEYLAQPGENHGFLLKHATGNYPKNSEIDAPINYADYYFLEALLRARASLAKPVGT